MKTRWIALSLVSTLLAAACAKVTVKPVKDGARTTVTSSEGVIYALPKTVVRAQFKLNLTKRSGAPFAPFASIFAPGGEPICPQAKCEHESTYALQDGVAFSTYGVPDPARVYVVEFTRGSTIDQSLALTWNEAGLINAATASVTNRAVDVAMSGLKLATGAFAKGGLAGTGGTNPALTNLREETSCEKWSSRYEHSDTDTWVIPTLRDPNKAKVKEPDPVLADALVETYCSIEKEDRDDMLNFNRALLSDATVQYVLRVAPLLGKRQDLFANATVLQPGDLLDRIDADISKAVGELYLGSKTVITWDGMLDSRWISDEKSKREELLKIDAHAGFCIGDNAKVEIPPEAKPIPPAMTFGTCPSPVSIYLAWEYEPAKAEQLSSMIVNDTEGDRGFRYSVPTQVRVKAENAQDKHTFGAANVYVAQLGQVVSLPAARRSKSLTYDLAFIEATGALKSFKIASTGGVDAGTIDSFAAAYNTVLDAQKAEADARETAQDELTILTREAALLKLRDDICTLKQKYGESCDSAQ